MGNIKKYFEIKQNNKVDEIYLHWYKNEFLV